jgi:hypothetical protein
MLIILVNLRTGMDLKVVSYVKKMHNNRICCVQSTALDEGLAVMTSWS